MLHQQFGTIVLAANWTNDFQPELVATLQKLHDLQASKQLATKDIFLIGPAPTWLHGLFKTVINAAIKDTPEHRLPARLNTGLIADFALDAKMRALAQRYGVTYISLLDILCNAEGCMTKLSDEPDALIGYDHGHLSLLGAQYVVSHFPAKLFE